MSTVFDEAVLEDRPEVDLSLLAASLRAEPAQSVVLAFDIGTSGCSVPLATSGTRKAMVRVREPSPRHTCVEAALP